MSIRKNRERKKAEHAAKQAADPTQSSAAFTTEQDKMLGLLSQHTSKLSNVNSREKKIELKAIIVEDYEPFLDGLLAADQGGQNPVVTSLMVWHFDIANFDRALELAAYAMSHDLSMPAHYEWGLSTVIAREISNAYLDNGTPTSEHLLTALELVSESDLPDKVSARLHKAYGASIEQEHPVDALTHYRRALALDSSSGVKKVISNLNNRIEKASKTGDV